MQSVNRRREMTSSRCPAVERLRRRAHAGGSGEREGNGAGGDSRRLSLEARHLHGEEARKLGEWWHFRSMKENIGRNGEEDRFTSATAEK